jgi:hypothetical protein
MDELVVARRRGGSISFLSGRFAMTRKGGMGVGIWRTLTGIGASLSMFTSSWTRRGSATSILPDIKASWLSGYGRKARVVEAGII